MLRRRGYAVMRSRYTEDCLAESLARGVRQYVIMGAGLDTFVLPAAFLGDRAAHLRSRSSSNPALEAGAKLSAARIQIPKNVIFAPVNFEEVSLEQGLAASGFDLDIPTFFSWLGVTGYLTEEAMDRTLKFVLPMPRSSEIVLDFFVPDELNRGGAGGGVCDTLRSRRADKGTSSDSIRSRRASREAQSGGIFECGSPFTASGFRSLLRWTAGWSWRTIGPPGRAYASDDLDRT